MIFYRINTQFYITHIVFNVFKALIKPPKLFKNEIFNIIRHHHSVL